ncbi:hypothetical protein LSAT2_018638 [Lamellibrachia satsuma]|nr:hypothetical protein LSAT2_018638 [Lamellibrachia satsuma]
MAGSLVLGFATFLTVTCVVLVAVSFATEHWVDTVVNRDEIRKRAEANSDNTVVESLKLDVRYFTRYRGLFRTCYPGNETAFLDDKKFDDDRVDGSCLVERGYELTRRTSTTKYGKDYTTRIHLMRCHFAFFMVSLLLSVVSAIVGGIGCYKASKNIVRTTALLMFLSAFFIAGGMAFFHGYEYLEKNKIEVSEFPAKYLEESQHKLLKDNSSTNYGFSYVLGWLGMAVAAVAAILYLGAAYTIAASIRSRRHRAERAGSFKGSERFQGSMTGVNDYPTSMMGGVQPGYPDPYMMTAAYQYPDVGNYGYPTMKY